MANLPRGRQKNVTGQGNGVHRRGSGTGAGPVGSGSFMSSGGSSSSGGGKRSGGSPSLLTIIIILAVMMMGGGGALSGMFGGSGGQTVPTTTPSYTQQSGTSGQTQQTQPAQPAQPTQPSQSTQSQTGTSSTGSSSSSGYNSLSSLFGGYGAASTGSSSSGWVLEANTGNLNPRVSAEARSRYTQIRGDGSDTVTIMVYMCGADLESRSGMATNDLVEMTKASISDNVNLIVYTGGCRQWKNNVVSSRTNEIYQIKDGGLKRLVSNVGSKPMTDPATLTEFIKFCSQNYPANRNELIFWDHGGGSITGYGYDEKYASSGSMDLAEINSALKNAGTKFDFIGFDTCLMATVETALVLDQYADYMVASEETEPGVGWYYTNWLTEFSADTSKPTIEVGKKIVDDFVDVCERNCPGQGTTLSVVDLAELGQTVPEKFSAFSSSTTDKIRNDEYKTVSDARYLSREFAKSTGIDQIDLVNFASNVGSEEADALVQTLLSAIKYNRTGRGMTNAYGLSVYFPYRKTSKVSTAVKTYEAIGLDEEYTRCIREFASMEVGGQVSSGSPSSPIPSLLGGGLDSGSAQSQEQILQLLSTFLGSGGSGLSSSDLGFFDRSIMEDENAMSYLANNQFDAGQLTWKEEDGQYKIILADDQKGLIQQVDMNLYVDDGEGYVDMGLDPSFEVDEAGNLVADAGETWLSINNQPVAYYHVSTVEDGEDYKITGYVPALLNGERVQLILLFTDEQPLGYVAGAQPAYGADVTETVSRGLIDLQAGDTLDFLCDFYSYQGEFQDSYYLGEQMTITDPENIMISDTILGEDTKTIEIYRFTDIYNNNYWSEFVPR